MELNEYQNQAKKTALYPKVGKNLIYPTLGLIGEAGEIANSIKKIERDDNNILTNERKAALKKELGDVLWYIAQTATELEINLDDIALSNLMKLSARKKRNTLHGSGDNRE